MRTAPYRPSLSLHPLAVLAAFFALGILAARFLPLSLKFVLACGVLCSLAALYGFVRNWALTTSVMLALSFSAAGAGLMILEKSDGRAERVREFYDHGLINSGDPVEITGFVMNAPEPAPDGFYLTLRVEKLRFRETERVSTGQVLLFASVRDRFARVEYEALELRYGARVRVMAALERAESFRNPGVSTLTEYLERNSLDATATIKSPLLVERLEDESVFLPLAWLYEWRQSLLAEIGERFSAEAGGVLKAALLGNRYQLSRATAERFREGGTFHVLVISGLHISFIGGFILFLMKRATRRRSLQFIVSAAGLWTYTLMVGAEVSVVRASLMFTLVAFAPVVHRRANSLNVLGAAALLLLVWRPSDLFDPSFQLTFLSVLAIVALSWPLLERLRAVGTWRPTLETPRPPDCSRAVCLLGETLFWSERAWLEEMAEANYSYKLFKTPLAARLERMRVQPVLRYAFGAMVISASVQLTLLPLLVLYFHRLSVAALVLNILVGVLMAALAIVTILALLLSQLNAWVSAPLFKLAEALSWMMVHSVDPFSSAQAASVRLPEYTGWPAAVYVLYYVPLLALAVLLARWRPVSRTQSKEDEGVAAKFIKPLHAIIAQLLLLVLIVAHPFSAGRPDKRLRVDFLDVGQGDAALLTMPDGTTLLVDAGGRPKFNDARRDEAYGEAETFERDTRSIGDAVVSEYLWWRGLDHVDYVLATHADADHIDGLKDVLRNFDVRSGIIARAPAADPEFAQFAATAAKYGVPLRVVGRGDRLRFGAVEAEVLWPPRTQDPRAPSGNNDSIVLRVQFGQRTFLLTGDVEKEAEAGLVASEPGDALRSDVLKVAHHGSKTSSTEDFVNRTRPAFAVISVGQRSPFGHPHKEVLERWRAHGAQVLTTGEHGTITVTTNGSDLRVDTFIKP